MRGATCARPVLMLFFLTLPSCNGWRWAKLASPAAPAPSGLAVGQPAPDVHGQDLDGVPFRLSDYRGKVIVLCFWGQW